MALGHIVRRHRLPSRKPLIVEGHWSGSPLACGVHILAWNPCWMNAIPAGAGTAHCSPHPARLKLRKAVMKVTVCQLHNERAGFAADWDQLVRHVGAQRSAILLLPEMPFFPWFPAARHFDATTWRDAIAAHDGWERRLSELAPTTVLGTRPVDYGDRRYAVGFMWNQDEDIMETIHVKSRLASEEGSWETSWYESAALDFEMAALGSIHIGMLIGAELWMSDQAKLYGEDGAQIIAVPCAGYSADPAAMDNRWLAGGRAAAEAACAYCIASSRGTHAGSPGGVGWIIAPDGQPLAITSSDQPIVTAEIDLELVTSRRHGGAKFSQDP